MGVEVLQRKRQPGPGARFSLFGDGLLERTRSTMLALLGLTAAVGLALTAVVMQADWPLIAGSPIPRAPVVHESIGGATALAGGKARATHGPAGIGRRAASARGRSGGSAGAQKAPAPTAAAELVSSPAEPVGGGGRESGSPGTPAAHPPASQPAPGQAPSGAPAADRPSPSPPAKPPPTPSPPEPSPPEAVASEAPPAESNVPPWSNGKGHAYGRAEDHGPG
jgi:hypothetical protein